MTEMWGQEMALQRLSRTESNVKMSVKTSIGAVGLLLHHRLRSLFLVNPSDSDFLGASSQSLFPQGLDTLFSQNLPGCCPQQDPRLIEDITSNNIHTTYYATTADHVLCWVL